MMTTHKGAVLDEPNKTMIGKMMPLLNEHQQRAFFGPYYEKLGYESAINTSDFTGISPMTLTAAKREVAEHENNSRACSQAGEPGRIRTGSEGRKSILEKQSGIKDKLLRLLNGNVFGDSDNLLTQTVKSMYTLTKKFGNRGYKSESATYIQ